jgi:hypothetical protein
MIDLISALTTVCFALASGIFLTLSYIEKPIWPLMSQPENSEVSDQNARVIHAELKRVIKLLPPTMMTVMGTGTLLTVIQAWKRNFDLASVTTLVFLIIGLGYILTQLFDRIHAVENTPSDGEIVTVRTGLGRLAAIHHVGLFTASSLCLMQLVLVIGMSR